jgi:hypothetical protein
LGRRWRGGWEAEKERKRLRLSFFFSFLVSAAFAAKAFLFIEIPDFQPFSDPHLVACVEDVTFLPVGVRGRGVGVARGAAIVLARSVVFIAVVADFFRMLAVRVVAPVPRVAHAASATAGSAASSAASSSAMGLSRARHRGGIGIRLGGERSREREREEEDREKWLLFVTRLLKITKQSKKIIVKKTLSIFLSLYFFF